MFRWGWQRLEAKVVDEKFVRRAAFGGKHRTTYQEWDYLIELPAGADGGGERLVIREKTFELRLPVLGKHVPVLVNKDRTKAAFDLEDPRIGTGAQAKRAKAARKERAKRAEERFERKLEE